MSDVTVKTARPCSGQPGLYTRHIRFTVTALCGFVLLGIILLTSGLLQAEELKRIEVQDSNNFRLSSAYKRMLLPDRLDGNEYTALRRYANIKLKTRLRDELDNLFDLTAWVHKRWQHDPYGMAPPQAKSLEILRAAERGEKFSCTEYSKVLRDIFRAHGYISRMATLQAPGIAYDGLGAAHVAVEVYSSQLNKWIFLDPQWGMYLQYKGSPINIYEYYQLKKQGSEQEVIFSPVKEGLLPDAAREAADYRSFLNQHLGYHSVDLLADEEGVHVLLAMEGNSWPLTFQGLPRNAQIFSNDSKDVYFDVNRVSLVLTYREDSQPLSKMNIDFSSEDDYIKKMPIFAAVPDFTVKPHHNMPWFSYFEYRIDSGKWVRLKDEYLGWNLRPGKNRLEMRAVNALERRGSITYLQIEYGSHSKR